MTGWFLAATIVGIAVVVAVIALVTPRSPLRSTFRRDARRLFAECREERPSATELERLPASIRRHLERSGALDRPQPTVQVIDHIDTLLLVGDRRLRTRYTQVNAVDGPARWAFIDTRLYGLPFQGLEGYLDGAGRMRGVLGKVVPLFDETGPDLDTGTLFTILAEALIVPGLATSPHIAWRELDSSRTEAVLRSGDAVVTGVVTVGPDGLMTSFRTAGRMHVDHDGTRRSLPWSVTLDDYAEVDGLLRPQLIRAIWHEDEDVVYFESRNPRFGADPRLIR